MQDSRLQASTIQDSSLYPRRCAKTLQYNTEHFSVEQRRTGHHTTSPKGFAFVHTKKDRTSKGKNNTAQHNIAEPLGEVVETTKNNKGQHSIRHGNSAHHMTHQYTIRHDMKEHIMADGGLVVSPNTIRNAKEKNSLANGKRRITNEQLTK